MANHYISKEITDRLYATMKRKNISTNQICRELNIAYPDFKAMLEGRQPCFNKWQKKIANVLGVERAELFKEFTIKSLEQQDVLDKIRAEIEGKIIKRPYLDFERRERDRNDAFLEVLDIIDKYKAEMEEK